MSPSIILKDAHVRYPVISSSGQVSLLRKVAEVSSMGFIKQTNSSLTHVHAVRGLSMSLMSNVRLGIVGRNGSGKSTLLKTIAGILYPERGLRRVKGSIASVLTVGAGLDPEKSARKNIQLVLSLFNIIGAEAKLIEQEIEEFIDVGGFFDLPVRTYSSGMMVRLSFALATSIPGEILLIDEVLGAGDLHFLERATQRLKARANNAKILVLATHSSTDLSRFCDHAIWMNAGRVCDFGKPEDVWANYVKGDDADLNHGPIDIKLGS
jgi:ABC-type polysaccharide/polyol phosphate transport system ATPase subunit